jgi:predicted lipid-binding transport protein (Tim44 family)
MKKLLVSLLVVGSAMAMTISDVEAKRLGSGKSMGRQSNNVTQQAPSASPAGSNFNQTRQNAAAPAAGAGAAAAAAKPASAWKGIAAGLIGGALLGAALSSLGMGGALASALGSILTFALIGLVIFFIFNYFRRKSAGSKPAFGQPAFAGVPPMPEQEAPKAFQSNNNFSSGSASNAAANVGATSQATWSIPADFDVPNFLRNSKMYFIRLQAAWDKADLNDIREFTTTEMFAEIKMQIQERGASANVTDVVFIEGELLGLETIGNDYVASVKFTGLIKEDTNAPTEPFSEVWNLVKPANGQGGWVLAGIQQL